MYDSRSDHPRGPKTRYGKSKHGSSHPDRAYERYYGDQEGRAVYPKPDLSVRESIADQGEFDAPAPIAGLKMLRLAEWEQALLMDGYGGVTAEQYHEEQGLMEATILRNDCRAFDVDMPEGMAWSSAVVAEVEDRICEAREAAYSRHVEDEDEDEDDYEPESAWLAATPTEFFEAMGDAWVIEGPTVHDEPRKGDHYVRLHELAREVGVESKHLIEYLRLEGEYVANHMSMVANPVAAIVRRQAEGLRVKYGERKQAVAVVSPWGTAITPPNRVRPGVPLPGQRLAPRPGRNPFATL